MSALSIRDMPRSELTEVLALLDSSPAARVTAAGIIANLSKVGCLLDADARRAANNEIAGAQVLTIFAGSAFEESKYQQEKTA